MRRHEVKFSTKIILLFLLVAITFHMSACSRFFGPSDEEVIKAIDNSGILKSGGFTVTVPPVVVEKGSRMKDGSWPVKVKVTLNMVLPNGQTATREITPIFNIHKSKDSGGKTVWTATLGTSMS